MRFPDNEIEKRWLLTFKMLVLLGILILTKQVYAQPIIWDYRPQKGFVYQISNDEAKLLQVKQKGSKKELFKKLMHTLVDTFNVDSGWHNFPEQGHFILAEIEKNQVKCHYQCIYPFEMYMHRDYGQLTFQVIDKAGNIRGDAKVNLGHERIVYDKETKQYPFRGNWTRLKNKTASIHLDGFTAYYNIQRKVPPTPYAYSHRNYFDEEKIYSYLISDKNKYRPNDSIRFKSYAVNAYRTPLKQKLYIHLHQGRIYKNLGLASQHRPGAYTGTIYLHDSLNLVLDQRIYLQLRDRNGKMISSCSFMYEDYELKNAKVTSKLEYFDHYNLKENELTISATDANGLFLTDAKAVLTIRTNSINDCFEDVVIVKDILLQDTIKLDPSKMTAYIISDSLFKKVNMSYQVDVKIINSENQVYERSHYCNYYHSNYRFSTFLRDDSLCVELYYNGDQQYDVPLSISYGSDSTKTIQLPYAEKLNPYIPFYTLSSEDLHHTFSASSLYPDFEINGFFDADSFRVEVHNPHHFDFNWNIYRGKALVDEGYGKELKHSSFIPNRDSTYYVDLSYVQGGEEHEVHRDFTFKSGHLDISLEMPDRVYPGQTVDALIKVCNHKGYPVKGVDLTAMASNSKLNYYVPSLPSYGKSSGARPKEVSYSVYDFRVPDVVLDLDYVKFKALAGLDTMKYYQFAYPQNTIFEYSYAISDSTQFAPFVMKNGEMQEVFYIEVDREPVYYSWADAPNPYSFYIEPDSLHEVKIRLADRLLVLDSVCLAPNQKHIFSFTLSNPPKYSKQFFYGDRFQKTNWRFWQKKAYGYIYRLSSSEISRHKHFTSVINTSYKADYLETEKHFTPLSFGSEKSGKVVGPVPTSYMNYHRDTTYSIRYYHEGGYEYEFKDNVVYKLTMPDVIPEILQKRTFDPYRFLNDSVFNKQAFMIQSACSKHYPQSFTGSKLTGSVYGINWSAALPKVENECGVVALLIQYPGDESYGLLYLHQSKISKEFELRDDSANILLLYIDGSYIKKEGVRLEKDIHLCLDFSQDEKLPLDDYSQPFYKKVLEIPEYRKEPYKPVKSKPRTVPLQNRTWVDRGSMPVSGLVKDTFGEPLPGVTVVVKGTSKGIITDFDGEWELDVNPEDVLSISMIGMVTQEFEVGLQSFFEVRLEEDLVGLDEVVVVGYGTVKKKDVTGSVASIGAEDLLSSPIQVEEQPEPELDELEETADDILYKELMQIKSIRSNFNDVGFWEPTLFTDRKGEARFQVTFPDNNTQWDAVVLGMNRKLKAGTCRQSIKSYKPIMAELFMPRFLTVGDSCTLLGKVTNYSKDSLISGEINWKYQEHELPDSVKLESFSKSYYSVEPQSNDSLKAAFSFTRNDGYFDGEERTIPVVEPGCVRAEGSLSLLQKGETKYLKAKANQTIMVELLDHPIDIFANEIGHLINYKYACNEQLASKLIGLLNFKILKQAKGEKFKYEKDINKIIRRLENNQNSKYQWGWWNLSEHTSHWISAHVLKALCRAQKAGYPVSINMNNIQQKAQYDYRFEVGLSDLNYLHALSEVGIELDWKKIAKRLDHQMQQQDSLHYLYADSLYHYRYEKVELSAKLKLMEIKQLNGISFELDSLLKYERNGILGEVFFDDGQPNKWWVNDELINNCMAYRIVSRDSSLSHFKAGLQLYFIGERSKYAWNTYRSATVIETVFKDVLENGKLLNDQPEVVINGQQIKEYPFKMQLKPGEQLKIEHQSGLPLHYMYYVHERVTKAKTGVEGFEINSRFENDVRELKAGQPVKLMVDVLVKGDVDQEYVMINIPIPGSCSYHTKNQFNYNWRSVESYREYFKEETAIFCEKMKPGYHRFEIDLLPRFSGKYVLNPAQVELMYFPVVNANEDLKYVKVIE